MLLESFHPAVAKWFERHLGEPTKPQREGWPKIQAGEHCLIAAPTGTGKTLSAFLWALDQLLRQGNDLRDETQVIYVSPLRALSNDVQKNLQTPLTAIREIDPNLPEIRVLVRTGDTANNARSAMKRKPPHVLVTTPESLYILLTSNSGRKMLGNVRTVIVDEIHALARDKRGSHLSLSLERLERLCPKIQRIGLSATQKPVETVAKLLVGVDRPCAIVDAGHLRQLDLDIVIPDSPLSAVCSHEQWGEIYRKMSELILAHRTTLIFTNTRKLAERLSARLSSELGADKVGCHHGSLSKEIRQKAEKDLKEGKLVALVATASLELGIDIGDVDLVLQIGNIRSIATLLQRVGRAGHGVERIPKGRIFPLTLDESIEAIAALRAIRSGILDRTPEPHLALDILAQQIVAEAVCAPSEQGIVEEDLFHSFRRAWPFRNLSREDFESTLRFHTQGRHALLHRDTIGGRILATKRARIPALTSGGAIPDNADYRVILDPEGSFIGTVNEDFAVESNVNDIFQLGNSSWRILKVESGIVRVADAAGSPPTIPFWEGEAPSRTKELSAQIGEIREQFTDSEKLHTELGIAQGLAQQVGEYLRNGSAALGGMPTQGRIIAERFFDESGNQQLVIHSLFGSRVNRALGLTLRKKICRGFGFELQAAANEESIVISLGPQHSFPGEEIFNFIHSKSARHWLTQALLAAPMFQTRWRWNVSRSLMLPRQMGGKRTPPPLQRMRADDLLTQTFPQVLACPETLPPGDTPIPDHPIVRQTIEDCLQEAMDIEEFLELLRKIENGRMETLSIDRPEPSVFAHSILAAHPYSFLDDAPIQERRTQAVARRQVLSQEMADELGALDPKAIALVRAQAWPQPETLEELHEALLWMGFVSEEDLREEKTSGWRMWLEELFTAGRVFREGERWFAAESSKDRKEILRGRLEALGPVDAESALIQEFSQEILLLEAEGAVLRARFEGRLGWCLRRHLARIHRLTLEGLRKEIEAVSASDFLRFLTIWQHVHSSAQLEGPRGVLEIVRQLAGFQAPARAWEKQILAARVKGYRPEWLDELSMSGELAWGRLWGSGTSAPRATPVALFPREEMEDWLTLCETVLHQELHSEAKAVLDFLQYRGASFSQEIARATKLLPSRLENALTELVGLGLVSCDAFGGMRGLFSINHRRFRQKQPPLAGRWSLFRSPETKPETTDANRERIARVLLARTGVIFRRVFEKERIPIPWYELLRVYRRLEARGEIHGGRFVSGFSGEQYALPQAVSTLRAVRRQTWQDTIQVSAADPLNFIGILTPQTRIASNSRRPVLVASA